MDNKSMSRKLLSTTLLYFIANFSTRAMSFLLLPLYTSHLTPADYGSVDMVFTVAQFLTPVITLNLTNAAFRFLIDAETEQERCNIISSSFFVLLVNSFVLLACSVLFSIVSSNSLLIAGAIYVIITSINSYLMQIYRGIKQNKTYAAMGVAHSFIQIMLNILFVVGLQLKSLSLLLSPILSSFATTGILLYKNCFYKYIRMGSFSKEQLRALFKFSLPTVPEKLIWWFLTGFAKMCLSTIHGEAALGVYAVANKFSDLLIVLYSIFNLAWAEFAYATYKEHNRDKIYSLVYNTLSQVILSCVLVLLPLTKLCVSWFLDESYLSGVAYMPVLYIMAYINILSTYYGNGFQSAKKTTGILISSAIGAGVNVPLCLFLIPKLEVWGAVIALFMANIALLISKKRMSAQFFKITVDPHFLLLLFPLTVCLAAFYLGGSISNVICLIMSVVVALLFNRKVLVAVFSQLFTKRRKA